MAADLNGDNKTDIVASSSTGIFVYMNNGLGNVNATIAGGIKIWGLGSFKADGLAGILTFSTSGSGDIDISGTGTTTFGNITVPTGRIVNILNSSNISVNSSRVFTVSGTTNIAASAKVSGSGSISVANSIDATLGIASAAGNATGSVQVTGTRTFNAGANYVYNGTANQITGNGLPATITGSIQINNTAGSNTVTLTTDATTTKSLVLTSGLLQVGSGKSLNIAATGTISATGGNFAAGNLAGKVSFVGAGSVSATGTLTFYDVDLTSGSGGVDFGNSGIPSIGNSFTINSGRSVLTNGPLR